MKSSRVLLVEIAIDCVGQRLDIGLGLGGVGEILSHDAQNKIIARCAVYNGSIVFHSVQLSGFVGDLCAVDVRDSGRNFVSTFLLFQKLIHQFRVGERFTIIVNLPEKLSAVGHGGVVVVTCIICQEHTAHMSVCIAVFLTERVYSSHADRGIAAA